MPWFAATLGIILWVTVLAVSIFGRRPFAAREKFLMTVMNICGGAFIILAIVSANAP